MLSLKKTCWAATLLASGSILAMPAWADDDVAKRLEEARARLDAAAREVAELSLQQGGDDQTRLFAFRSHGERRAILGVQLGAGDERDDARKGARVAGVSPGGPAAAADIRAGDRIVGIQGTDLRRQDSPERELVQQMRKVEPDQKVKLKVERDGKVRDVEVVARAAPPMQMSWSGGPPGMAGRAMAPMPFEAGDFDGLPGVVDVLMHRGGGMGLELANLTPKLGQYFGVDKGVLVLKTSADGKLKLEEGDVLLAIDGREPSSASHALRILRSYQEGEKVKLRVQRQRKALTLDGEIAPRPRPMRAPIPPLPAVPAAAPPAPGT